MSFLVLSSSYY